LSDAYGSAGSVPENLRRLASSPGRGQDEALDELYNGLCHQGATVYSATPRAVPFLVELAAAPQVRCRAEILFFLAAIARATGSFLSPDRWEAPKQRHSPECQRERQEERQIVLAAREAVCRGLDLYLALLNDPNPQLGVAAADVLSSLAGPGGGAAPSDPRSPGLLEGIAEALRERFCAEPDLAIRKALLPHVHALAGWAPESAALVRELTDAGEMPLRLEALFCLSAGKEPLPPTGARLLADLWRDPTPGLVYYDAELPPPDDATDPDEKEEPNASVPTEEDGGDPDSLPAVIARMRAFSASWDSPARRAERLRDRVFDALRQVGSHHAEALLPVLRSALEAYVHQLLGIEAERPLTASDWASVRTIEGCGLDCDALLPLLAPCVNLERLWLVQLRRITDAGMAHLPQLPRLRELSLLYSAVTDTGLPFLTRLPALERLVLIHTPVSDAGMASVAQLPCLRILAAGQTGVGDAGADHLSAAPALEVMNLSETAVGEAGATALARIPTLVDLTLSRTLVGDAGAAALAHHPRLRRLDLWGTDLTDAGLAALAEAPALAQLNVAGTRAGDAGIRHLERAPCLEELNLYHTHVSPAAVERLRRALPGCRIRSEHLP